MCDNHTHDHAHEEGQVHDHTHEHTHEHAHDHIHEDGQVHDHAHEHSHEHPHEHAHDHAHQCHCHDGQKEHSTEESLALLNYMIEHNRHHGEDLHEIFHALEKAGHKPEAELVHKAMHLFEDGNETLAEAYKLLGGK